MNLEIPVNVFQQNFLDANNLNKIISSQNKKPNENFNQTTSSKIKGSRFRGITSDQVLNKNDKVPINQEYPKSLINQILNIRVNKKSRLFSPSIKFKEE